MVLFVLGPGEEETSVRLLKWNSCEKNNEKIGNNLLSVWLSIMQVLRKKDDIVSISI